MTTNGKIQVADAFRHLDPNQKLAEGVVGGFPRIGIKGKTWKFMYQGMTYFFVREDDGSPLPALDVVIVGANPNISKMYYPPGTYQDDSANAPTCASTDGVVPDRGVPIQQAKACAACKHNEWLPNRGGKECQDHKRLAVILLPYMKTKPALEAPMLEPVYLKVPPASLRSFKGYSDSLQHRGAHFASVITRITFDPVKLFQMNFEVKQPLTNAEAPLILPLLDSPQTRGLIGGITEIQEALPDLPEDPKETGLMAAFGGAVGGQTLPAKRGPGRPKKPAEVAKTPPTEVPQQEASAEAPEDTPAPWEEGDEGLDTMMSNLLGNKFNKSAE